MKSSIHFFVCFILLTAAVGFRQAHAEDKPVKVYILSGQSNMVGIGQVHGRGIPFGGEFVDAVVSVYPGEYDPEADYDKMEPIKTRKLEVFGGGKRTPYPDGGVRVVRGYIKMNTTGVYEFRPGYRQSNQNVMTVDGKEVHRNEPGKAVTRHPVKITAGEKVPFKIVYFTDKANSIGWKVRVDIPGTLTTVVKQQDKFPYLLDEDGNWASRDDVWYKGVVTAGADKWLSVGCGASSKQIGPELGFGWAMGDYHDAPVLIIKASQGNRSLAWDFLPPGSDRFTVGDTVYAGYKDPKSRWKKGADPEKGGWYAGKQYDDCFNAAKDVLANFDKNFPMWKGRGYEIAGFGWWQGHKDSGSAVHRQRYEQNLVQLIKALRKDFDAPKAPFVVATIGFHGWEMPEQFLPIAKAQLAVDGETGNYPAFKGNVKSVETRDFWRSVEQSPKGQDYHYNQNGETYFLIGQAMGKGMIALRDTAKKVE